MSWEEDYLLRRVGEITAALKEADVLDECAQCTTLFAAELDKCPNCGHPKGEKPDPAVATPRPTPLGVESTSGANALPAATVHGGADANEATRRSEESEQSDDTDDGDAPEPDAPPETINGKPASYTAANVETLRAELTTERKVFVPSGQKKADLVRLLREDDKRRATDAAHGS